MPKILMHKKTSMMWTNNTISYEIKLTCPEGVGQCPVRRRDCGLVQDPPPSPPPPNKQTGPTENITFSQVRWRVVKIKGFVCLSVCLSVRIYFLRYTAPFFGGGVKNMTNRDRSLGQNQNLTNFNILNIFVCRKTNVRHLFLRASVHMWLYFKRLDQAEWCFTF